MTDPSEPTIDLSGFKPGGPQYAYDAFILARGVTAVLAAANPDQPSVQFETFTTGTLLVATDSYSLLQAWIPWPTGGGWANTVHDNVEPPDLDEAPDDTFTVHDPDNVLPKWSSHYGKAARGKNLPDEQATVELGTLTGQQAALTSDLEPVGVRFGGDSLQVVTSGSKGGVDWRTFAHTVAKAPEADGPVRIHGTRAAQLGRLANIGVDRVFTLRPRRMPSGDVIAVGFPGVPHVVGYLAAAR